MGDEELNFTDEESRCWADDPRNQAPEVASPWHPMAVFLLMMAVCAIIIWLAGSRLVEPQPPLQPAAPPPPHALLDVLPDNNMVPLSWAAARRIDLATGG